MANKISDETIEYVGILAKLELTEQEKKDAKADMEKIIRASGKFPVPPQYAHPVVLTRMIRIIREGRAQTAAAALEVLKTDLQALNSSVQVEQEEYDEVVTIKPMFLLSGYQ